MKRVLIAGATGYLGRFLCEEYRARGWYVTALVRAKATLEGLAADALVEAEATRPETLGGVMEGADLVISALGITRQKDGLGYWDVDYGANLNLLREAERAGVARFAYVHVFKAAEMAEVPLVAAKSAFVAKLQASPISSTVVAPTGYFSDMGELFEMAQKGRVGLFGSGLTRVNPIHGADLAAALASAVERGAAWADIGGPETFTQVELARLAFDTLGKRPRIYLFPDLIRRIALWALPRAAPRHVAGPLQFFLTATALDMEAPAFGQRRLADHFATLASGTSKAGKPNPISEKSHVLS